MTTLFAPLVSEAIASSGSALISAAWQGALLALLVWLCLRAIPGLSAATRSAVWLSVFALLLALQVVPLLSHSEPRNATAPVLRFDPRWSLALAALWLSASLVRAAQLTQGVLYLRRLVRESTETPLTPEQHAALEAAAPGRKVRVCTSDGIARPSVIGFFRPRVLIPAKLLQNLAQDELRQVLVHELEHLRRADDWTNLLQKLILVVFPLNPALAWVERRLCAERELACDDRVLATGSGRKAYALCLAHMAEFALLERGYSLVLGAWERRPELVRRVHRILRAPAQTMPRRAALGVSAAVLASAVCGAIALAHSPQLVSFAPLPAVARSTAPSLPEDREAMPEARLIPASMPVTQHRVIGHIAAQRARTITALAKPAASAAKPEIKLAALRQPLPPADGKLLVMTEWNDLGNQQRMILAQFRSESTQTVNAVPAIYIVATPSGWMIVQI